MARAGRLAFRYDDVGYRRTSIMGLTGTDPARMAALDNAAAWFDEGGLLAELSRRVAIPTESTNRDRAPELLRYLTEEVGAAVAQLGFEWTVWPNPVAGAPPMLFAERTRGCGGAHRADLRPRRRGRRA